MPGHQVSPNAPGIGAWGGSCTCPDGAAFFVGDNGDHCGSLACVNGVSGTCNKFHGEWAHQKVICSIATHHYVTPNAIGVGTWGGTCTCPDGSVFLVGDEGDYCGSLACSGGAAGHCERRSGPWSKRRVTCKLHKVFTWKGPKGHHTNGACKTDLHDPPMLTAWEINDAECRQMCSNRDDCYGYQHASMASREGKCCHPRCDLFLSRISGIRPVGLSNCFVKAELNDGHSSAQSLVPLQSHPRAEEWERVLASPHAKIWAMFGPREWVTRRSGQDSCFGRDAAAWNFFETAFNGDDCYRTDWHANVFDGPRPQYSGPTRALMGLEGDIHDFCAEHSPSGWRNEHGNAGHGQREFVHTCIEARLNVLRMMGGTWNMCENLKWMLCAARGKLPGQGGDSPGVMTFAVAPKSRPPRQHKWHHGVQGGYEPNDVYDAEVAMLSLFCANRRDLFSVERGQDFRCQLHKGEYDQLAGFLIKWSGA